MRRSAALWLIVALQLLGGTVGIFVVERPKDAPAVARARTVAGPTRAQRFEPVVREISRFVEGSRGLKFKRAVRTSFLDDAAFATRRADTGEVDADGLAIARTLGLVDPALPTDVAADAPDADDVVGFYDFIDNKLFVRGTEPTAYTRYVLAHELTHALQDQHFNLNRITTLGVQDEADIGLLTIAEGDAMRVADAYYASLSPDEQKEIDAIEDPTPDPTTTTTTAPPAAPIPWPGDRGGIYADLFPYALGPTLVQRLIEQGGQASLDFAFRHPVVSSEQLAFPTKGEKNEQPVPVATPPADGEPIAEGPLGLYSLNIFFYSQWTQVSWPIDAWSGGRYVAWGAGDETCVRFSVVLDTGYAATQLRSNLELIADFHGRSTVTGPKFPQPSISYDKIPNAPVTYTTCGLPKTRTWAQAQAVLGAIYNRDMAETWRTGGYSGSPPRYVAQPYQRLPDVTWIYGYGYR